MIITGTTRSTSCSKRLQVTGSTTCVPLSLPSRPADSRADVGTERIGRTE